MKKLFLLIIVIIPCYFIYSYHTFKTTILTKEKQTIEINQGENYYDFAEKFDLSKFYLKIYLKLNPPSKNLQAGTYTLESGLNINGIINSLSSPVTNDLILTILPGRNIYDIDDLLTKNNLIKSGDLIEFNKKNISTLEGNFYFLRNAKTLEGFLYPDTYNINPNNFKLEEFLDKLLTNFDKKVIKGLGIDSTKEYFIDNINLASIVQKEANQEDSIEETKIIAGILKKRLENDRYLGADATVCYPYELTSINCTQSFITNHITDVNNYNTRTMKGLPETPICNPTADTIDAVYNSKESPYYFYLHDNNGQIHYATTNEEHLANKALYIK